MTTVASLVFQMGADVARLREDMAKASKTVDTAAQKMKASADFAMKALGGLGIALGAAQFASFVKGAIDAADNMSKLSQKMGVTVKDVAGLQLAFRQSGVSAEQLVPIMAKLGVAVANGSEALTAMGISSKNADGTLKSTRQVLGEVSDSFSGYADGAAKTALAVKLFGEEGAKLMPLLNGGSEALDNFDAMAKKLGLTMSDQTAQAAEKFNDTIDLLGQGMQGVGMQIAAEILPTLQTLADKMFGAVTEGDRLAQVSKAISFALKVLGSAFIVVVEIVAVFARGVTAALQAVKLAMTGDFKGALDAYKQGMVASFDSMKESLTNIGELWTETGNTTVAAMVQTRTAIAPVIAATKTLSDESKKQAEALKELADQRKKDLAFGEYMNKQVEERAKKEAELLKDIIKLHEDSVKPFEDSVKAMKGRIEAIKDEDQAIKLAESLNISLAEAVERVNLEKLKQQQIDAMGNPDAVANIQREIDLQKEYIELVAGKEQLKASRDAAKQAATDWQKASEKIQDSITDALMRGFESGKGFIKNLVDTIKNMFSTMVLRPIIQGVVGSGLSAIGLGGAGAAQAGSLESMGQSMLGNFAQSAIGTSIISSSAAYGAAIGTTSIGAGSQAAMLAAQTGSFGTAGTLATAQAAGTGSSLLSSAAAAGPYVAAALVVLNALGAFRSKKVVGGGLSGTLGEGDIESYDLQRRGGTLFSGPSYSIVNRQVSAQSEALQTAFAAIRDATAGMATQLGLANDSIVNFTTRLGEDLIHPDTGGYGIKLDGLNPEQAAQKVQEALQSANEQMAQQLLGTFETVTSTVGGFRKRQVSEQVWVGGDFVRDGETASQALQRLSGSLTSVNGALDAMNAALFETSLAGADAASKLLDVFGGMENFTQATGAYYQSFFSESERNEKLTARLTDALGRLNFAVPDSIAGFRELVDAQDLMTDQGRSAYASLIALAPAFKQVSDFAEASAQAQVQAQAQAAQAIADQAQDLQDQLLDLTSTAEEVRARERASIHESNLAVYDRIQAIKDGQIALEQAAQAERDRAEALRDLTQKVMSETDAAFAGARQSISAAMAASEASITATYNALQKTLDSQKKSAEAARQVATENLRSIRSIFDLLKTQIQDLLAEAAPVYTEVQGRSFIRQALDTALATGYLPDAQDLSSAITGARAGTENRNFATAIDQRREQMLLINDLKALQKVSGNQLTVEERHLAAAEAAAASIDRRVIDARNQYDISIAQNRSYYDAMLVSAQNQLDALRGVDTSVSSVSESIALLMQSLRRERIEPAQLVQKNAAEKALTESGLPTTAAGSAANAVKNLYASIGRVGDLAPSDAEIAYWASLNLSMTQLTKNFLESAASFADHPVYGQFAEKAKSLLGTVPAFAAGGYHSGGMRLVGENGPELEVTGPSRIYNASQTADMMGGGLAVEIRALREEVSMLRAEARATAINTGRQADLMKRVTRNGEAMTVMTDIEPLEVTTS